MAAAAATFAATHLRPPPPPPHRSISSHLLSPSTSVFPSTTSRLRFPSLHLQHHNYHSNLRSPTPQRLSHVAGVGKLADADLVPVPPELDGFKDADIPTGAGIYGIYDSDENLQFIGITRNIAGSVLTHKKALPDLCCSVKVGLIDDAESDHNVLTEAWKSWMQEHIESTGKIPPGNETGNTTWQRRPQKKTDLRLTPGRHVELTIPLEELIDRLVKENKVVAFIKGSRNAPKCGFSQRVVGILESHGVDYQSVDVLDEEYNFGLRETLKKYSSWPTFPQIFFKGELVGGCDILAAMDEKGEIAKLLKD